MVLQSKYSRYTQNIHEVLDYLKSFPNIIAVKSGYANDFGPYRKEKSVVSPDWKPQ